jgi:hypothetical protein
LVILPRKPAQHVAVVRIGETIRKITVSLAKLMAIGSRMVISGGDLDD